MRAGEFSDDLDELAPRPPLQRSLAITHAGLMLGRGTILARMSQETPPRLAIDGEGERILALLSAALSKSVAPCLIGSLLCTMDAKTPSQLRVEYYPIYLKDVDQGAYSANKWITLARSGGISEFERKVQWLFEKPSMRLLISEEQCADGLGARCSAIFIALLRRVGNKRPKRARQPANRFDRPARIYGHSDLIARLPGLKDIERAFGGDGERKLQ